MSEGTFEGSLPNASGTRRNELGGVALFRGVMMRSRTGYAMALRLPDGRIEVRQVPWIGLGAWRDMLGKIPLLRGIVAFVEMMIASTRALRFSAARLDVEAPPTTPARERWILLASVLMMTTLFIFLPNVIAAVLFRWVGPKGLLEAGSPLTEADYPLLYHVATGALRLLMLTLYTAALGLDRDILEVFRYHGAEHQAAHALEENKDVTVARARAHEVVHPRCGTTFLALFALWAVPVFALVEWLMLTFVSGFPGAPFVWRQLMRFAAHLAMVPLLIGLCFELARFGAAHWRNPAGKFLMAPGLWLQRFTTRLPDDAEREVAIVALFAALAIGPEMKSERTWIVRGLEDDESAPGHVLRSPARTRRTETTT